MKMSSHKANLQKETEIASKIDEQQCTGNKETHHFIVLLHPDIQAQLDEITAALKRLEKR